MLSPTCCSFVSGLLGRAQLGNMLVAGNTTGPVGVGIQEGPPGNSHPGASGAGGAEQAPAGSGHAVTVASTVTQTDTVLVDIPGMTGMIVGCTAGIAATLASGASGTADEGCTTMGAPLAGFHNVVAEGAMGAMSNAETETTAAASAAAESD